MSRRSLVGTALAGLLLLALPGVACAQEGEASVRMSLADMKKRRAEIVVVDVRAREAYLSGHVPGSVSIPLDQIEARADELPRGKTVVTYCA